MVKVYERVDGASNDVESAIKELSATVNQLEGGGSDLGAGTAFEPAEGIASASEGGNATYHRTVITLTDVEIALADEGGVGQWAATKIYDFPAGMILWLGAVVDCTIELEEAAWLDTAAGDIALGTAAATDGNAFSSAEINLMPNNDVGPLTAQAGNLRGKPTTGTDATATFDGTGTPVDVYLNLRIDDNAAHTAGTAIINGTITLNWINLGAFAA